MIDASLYPLFLPLSAALGFFVDMSGRGSGGPGGRGSNSVAQFRERPRRTTGECVNIAGQPGQPRLSQPRRIARY
ncbi:hypothetical protein BSU04_11710 [Caballeronia sordidicola]|uniref:Uncharacterized protein n=1 Tax=Caballeronia sordidicola TaxID=196367 RepID=A0A226X4N9_CABSO|nr:hypothetical protein BSU04_11710 [Caballeronia sordidicola]